MTIVNNLQNKTTYLFLLFFIISCKNQRKINEIEKIQIPFSESGLKDACTRTIKTLDNEIHGIHYIYKSGKGIDKDSLNNLLFSISQFDDFNDDNCVKYSNNTFESWDKTIKTEKCYKLEKTEFIMENPANLKVDNPIKTSITLTDFDLYINGQTKKITLRFLNDYKVINIIIDDNEIQCLSESIPIGLGIVIQKMDSLKHLKNASR